MALPSVNISFNSIFAHLVRNSERSLNQSQISNVASPLRIRVTVDENNKSLSIEDNGMGMSQQGLAEVVRNGQHSMSGGFCFTPDGFTFYTASLYVRKVTVRTKRDNDYQYEWESTEYGSVNISRDASARQLHRGTEVTLFLFENQFGYLEEEKIKEVVKNECGSIGHPIYFLAAKENESNQGEIQEEASVWRVMHEPEPLVFNASGILGEAAKANLGEKVDHVILVGPQNFVDDMPCRLNGCILELNRNNEMVKRLIMMIERGERGEPVQLAVELLYVNALLNKKPKEPVTPFWERIKNMTRNLRSCCVIGQGACTLAGAFNLCDENQDPDV